MVLTSSLHQSLNLTLTVTGRGPVDNAFWLHFFHSSSHLGNEFKHKNTFTVVERILTWILLCQLAGPQVAVRAYLEAKIPLSRHYEQKRS